MSDRHPARSLVRALRLSVCVLLVVLVGCRQKTGVLATRTLASGATQRDVRFWSNALGRNTTYRIIVPATFSDLFPFAAALSPPVDVPERAFGWRRPLQSISMRAVFGPPGSRERQAADPFVLAHATDPAHAPYLFLAVGHEPLRPPILRFEALLDRVQAPHEFHIQPGGHEWRQWNAQLPDLFAALSSRLATAPPSGSSRE